jgi:hypothetical protein
MHKDMAMTAEINGSRRVVWQGAIDSKEWLVKQSEDGCRHTEESSNDLREFSRTLRCYDSL